jgi:hypothetical protein
MGMGAAPAGAGDGVFANTDAAWGNRYVPSVGNAIGSSDILVKMAIDAPEQQVRPNRQIGDTRHSFASGRDTTLMASAESAHELCGRCAASRL